MARGKPFKVGHIPIQKGKTKKEFPKLSNSGVKKGNIPWNAGTKGKGIMKPNQTSFKNGNVAPKTAFKLGNIPWNKGIEYVQISKENHYNWKGGFTPLYNAIRGCAVYNLWRKAVFHKDKFQCQDCGNIGGRLEAHHIYPFAKLLEDNMIESLGQAIKTDELWDINNGVTFCIECHKKRRSNNV